LTPWHRYLRQNLATIVLEEEVTPTEAMKLCADRKRDKRCEHPFCPLALHEREAGKMGQLARETQVRRCRGQCGGTAYHKTCLMGGGSRFQTEEKRQEAWPGDRDWCYCGCGLVDEEVDDGEDSEDEVQDLTETAGEKRQRENREKLENYKQQIDDILKMKQAMLSASKGAAGGAAKTLER